MPAPGSATQAIYSNVRARDDAENRAAAPSPTTSRDAVATDVWQRGRWTVLPRGQESVASAAIVAVGTPSGRRLSRRLDHAPPAVLFYGLDAPGSWTRASSAAEQSPLPGATSPKGERSSARRLQNLEDDPDRIYGQAAAHALFRGPQGGARPQPASR